MSEYNFSSEDMTDEDLIAEVKLYHCVIKVYGCYSRYDLWRMQQAEAELEERGYEVFEVPQLIIQKPGQEATVPQPLEAL